MNIEKMFNDEVRDKKRTASGVHHKTGKNGYTGTIRFISELLKGKEKREYRGTGRVRKYNMYDTIMPFTEYLELPTEEQKKILMKYRERHANKDIMQTWKISHNVFYRLVNDLDIPKTKRESPFRSGKKVGTVPNALPVIKEKLEEKQMTMEIIDKKEKENGMTLSLNGTYTADEIVRKLEKFGLILSDEPAQFKIELHIKEMA